MDGTFQSPTRAEREFTIYNDVFMMISENLYSIFIRYLQHGRFRAPPQAELYELIPSFQIGARTNRRALQSKFKSWSKRMTLIDDTLIMANTGKVIIPKERCVPIVMEFHRSNPEKHLTIDEVVSKIQHKYTWSRKNWGMDWDIVSGVLGAHCPDENCQQGLQARISPGHPPPVNRALVPGIPNVSMNNILQVNRFFEPSLRAPFPNVPYLQEMSLPPPHPNYPTVRIPGPTAFSPTNPFSENNISVFQNWEATPAGRNHPLVVDVEKDVFLRHLGLVHVKKITMWNVNRRECQRSDYLRYVSSIQASTRSQLNNTTRCSAAGVRAKFTRTSTRKLWTLDSKSKERQNDAGGKTNKYEGDVQFIRRKKTSANRKQRNIRTRLLRNQSRRTKSPIVVDLISDDEPDDKPCQTVSPVTPCSSHKSPMKLARQISSSRPVFLQIGTTPDLPRISSVFKSDAKLDTTSTQNISNNATERNLIESSVLPLGIVSDNIRFKKKDTSMENKDMKEDISWYRKRSKTETTSASNFKNSADDLETSYNAILSPVARKAASFPMVNATNIIASKHFKSNVSMDGIMPGSTSADFDMQKYSDAKPNINGHSDIKLQIQCDSKPSTEGGYPKTPIKRKLAQDDSIAGPSWESKSTPSLPPVPKIMGAINVWNQLKRSENEIKAKSSVKVEKSVGKKPVRGNCMGETPSEDLVVIEKVPTTGSSQPSEKLRYFPVPMIASSASVQKCRAGTSNEHKLQILAKNQNLSCVKIEELKENKANIKMVHPCNYSQQAFIPVITSRCSSIKPAIGTKFYVIRTLSSNPRTFAVGTSTINDGKISLPRVVKPCTVVKTGPRFLAPKVVPTMDVNKHKKSNHQPLILKEENSNHQPLILKEENSTKARKNYSSMSIDPFRDKGPVRGSVYERLETFRKFIHAMGPNVHQSIQSGGEGRSTTILNAQIDVALRIVQETRDYLKEVETSQTN